MYTTNKRLVSGTPTKKRFKRLYLANVPPIDEEALFARLRGFFQLMN